MYITLCHIEGVIKFNVHCVRICGAGGKVVGCLTALEARNSRVRLFSGVLLGFFIELILLVALWVLEPTQPLKKTSTANIS